MATTPSVRFAGSAGLDRPDGPAGTALDEAGEDGTLARAKAGDTQAFARLVRVHQRSVYGLALRALGSRMEAEDVAQDVFLQLHLGLGRLESAHHLAFWLRRTVSHRVIDRLRRRRRNPEVVGFGAGGAGPGDSSSASRDVDSTGAATVAADVDLVESPGLDSLLVRRLEERVAELPVVARLVLTLRYQEDLDPAQIARMLDLSVNTVKSHLKRSLARLRAQCDGSDST
jgi:RNA polymerase sigma-70 factor, ECF subfamily